MKRTPTCRNRVDVLRSQWRFRPRVEWLESRLQPGETFGFGFLGGALAGTALDLFSLSLGVIPPEQAVAREAVGEMSLLTSDAYPANGSANPTTFDHRVLPALVQPSTLAGDLDILPEDLSIPPVAIQRPRLALSSGRKALDSGPVPGLPDSGPWHSGIALSSRVPGVAAEAPNASGNLPLADPLNVPISRLAPNGTAFDPWSGTVLIRGAGAGHTIEEGITSRGFLDVTLDGQPHSSDPASATFDPLLAGATAARVTGIQLDGGGAQDMLTLGAQQLAGGLTVTAPGATVVAQDVSVSGSLTIQAADITVQGTLRGSGISLAATGWVNVEDAGRVLAASGAAGGRLTVFADKFVNTGQLHADGSTGGQIVAEARNILNAGAISADGSRGAGGMVGIAFTGAYIDTVAALTSANGGTAGPGGHVVLNGGTTGHLFSSGRQQATGRVGGAVDLLGREVVLDGGTADVSGEDGGGSIRVGGDFHGDNAAVVNAEAVTVTAATTLQANAQHVGDGGQVAVWANSATDFQGAVSARGGVADGAGGWIDVSSRGSLSYDGSADAGASLGKEGQLLLDPKNLIIGAAPVGVFPQFDLIDPHPTPGGRFGVEVTVLSGGNIVVTNPNDDFGGSQAGAVYLFDSLSGALISALVGSHPHDVMFAPSVMLLSNGNYVVLTPDWYDNRGAATWGSGTHGVSGPISDANSLVGSDPNDLVGIYPLTRLSNGNYLVNSAAWNGNRGAVTWGSGTTGIHGPVSDANSLIGSNPNDAVGDNIFSLSNGNYVVDSAAWSSKRGAVTWGDGTTGIHGPVSEANSLIGSDPNDLVGNYYITSLSNGNYVVISSLWNNKRGAVTWGDGTRGVSGPVSETNSLVGTSPNDQVGYRFITPLSNGNYVVQSEIWNGERGAVTWGDGTRGVSGPVSDANSLVGTNPGDQVGGANGLGPLITPLGNGNYVARSIVWNGGDGAATWGDGTRGVRGPVSESNSLVGTDSNESVGSLGVSLLNNGNYLLKTESADRQFSAATWVNGETGHTLDGQGVITPQNSLIGSSLNYLFSYVVDPTHQSFLVSFGTDEGGQVTVGLTDPNQFTYARGQSQTVALTPDFLTATLNTGTAVVLQASNDITVDDPITVSAHSHGGALTLQAGRSILLNASISTDNGPLTLIANDTVADGVIDSQRDPGNATIVMAGGTILDTGTAPLDIELRDGAGLTHADSRAINLQTLTAGSVMVVNDGPDAGSDIRLGTVTTNGPQRYGDPHGVTTVTADLTTGDAPIMFADSVVVNDGVSVDTGSGTVNFVGVGTQTLRTGADVSFPNLNHTGSGTLQLSGALTITGTLLQSAGTFDANDQPVTVNGATVLTGGTYLAGSAPQTFAGGFVETDGTFTSSMGPMTVHGAVTLTGGTFGGQGNVDQLTVYGGTVAPGTDMPGVLRVAGPVSFNPLTTFTVLLDGTHAGRGYSQLRVAGSVNLGGSTLQLVPGLEPPLGRAFKILTAAGGIQGTFAGLPEGAFFDQGGFQFQITYQGGAYGRSVVLTRVS